jgi:hypothetical protein
MRLAERRTKAEYLAGEMLKFRSDGRPMIATWSGPALFAQGDRLIGQWFSDAGESQREMFPEETSERASRDALAA